MNTIEYELNLLAMLIEIPKHREDIGCGDTPISEWTTPMMRRARSILQGVYCLAPLPRDAFDKRTTPKKIGLYKEAARRFTYDPQTGAVYGSRGRECGHINAAGYVSLGFHFQGKTTGMLAHRLAWYMVHGEIPTVVDHINGDRADNRICNIRNVTQKENCANRHDSSDTRNVYKMRNTYSAQVCVEGHKFDVGSYRTKREAINARDRCENMSLEELFEFAPPRLEKNSNTGLRGITQVGNGSYTVQRSIPKSMRGKYGRKIHIGTFHCIEEAKAARDKGYALFDKGLHPKTRKEL